MVFTRAISLAACVTLAGALSSLSTPKRKQTVADDFPTIAKVLQPPKASLQAIGDRVSEFEGLLTKRASEHKKLIAQQKSSYEQTLLQQVTENEDLKRGNRKIEVEIDTLNQNYTQLRSEASALQQTALHLKNRLEAMRANISLATEFANQALSADGGLDAAEVQVLKELDAEDALKRREAEHERSLQKLGSAQKVAMFQFGAQSTPAATQQMLLSKLQSSMEELQRKQGESVAALKEAFEGEFHKLEATRDGLLAEQARLTEQRASLQKLCDELTVVAAHFKTASRKMHSEESALKRFSERLSARPTPSLEEQPTRA